MATKRTFTKAECDEFLRHVSDGLNRSEAARQISSTGSAFRTLCRRDPEFQARYEKALDEGKQGVEDKVRDAIWRRALAGKTQGSDRLLLVLGEAHLPEFGFRRQRKLTLAGSLEVTQIDAIDAEIRRLLGELEARGEVATAGSPASSPVAGGV